MTPREFASLGGKAAQAAGTAYKFTSEQAKAAGRKGGLTRAARYAAANPVPKPKKKTPYVKQDSVKARYIQQRSGAARRGIGWEFTFETWWAVWQQSGKWDQRGIKKGQYVMARHGDAGPYASSNVSIVTNAVNVREALARRATPISAFGHLSQKWRDYGKCWYYKPARSKSKPYEVRVRRRYIGCFATQQEAEAAVREALSLLVTVQGEATPSEANHAKASSRAGVGQRLKLSTDTHDGAGFFLDQADRDRARITAEGRVA